MCKLLFILLLFLFSSFGYCHDDLRIQPGAEQLSSYIHLLGNKRVGLFVNHSSLIGQTHLVDALTKQGIHVTKIFVPEHGLRGDASDGERITNSIDEKTNIPVISLYGKKVKPTPKDLEDVDILIFDIQDVGVRFYTYIASLQKFMEAALQNNKQLIILDRPNPNGFYVDGPVLTTKSFTGLQPIPIVHGMTIGEYAKMLVGEKWLDVTPTSKAAELKLTVIPVKNYTHKSLYEPPVKPSPNLPTIQSIYWYPSIGLMEGTIVSVGRGTDKPFQVFGHPNFSTDFTFIPQSKRGAEHPPYQGLVCHGWILSQDKKEILKDIHHQLQIKYLIKAYQAYPNKKEFFPEDKHQKMLLAKQISAGLSEKEIRASWEPRLSEFKKIRKKYLLYPDFE